MGDKTIEIGDFLFERKKNKLWNDINSENSNKKYEDKALELMRHHYNFFSKINDLKEHEAVLRGAKIICTHGNYPICLDMYEDHGVYDRNTPVMSCADCKTGQNIYSFGACGNEKYEPVYSDMLPPPKEIMKDNKGNDRHKCLPIISDSLWGLGDEKYRSIFFYALVGEYNLVFGKEWDYNEKEYKKALKKRKKMKNKEEYVKMLMSNANLLCLYGGIITVAENADVIDDVVENIESEENITELPLKEEIYISSWLKAYKGEPKGTNGRRVYYDKKERKKLTKINPAIDWYSYEGQVEKNKYCKEYLEGQSFNLENGVLLDSNKRYWVTLGPRVFDPDYPDTGKCQADEFREFIGCRVDAVLYRMNNENEYIYIECVWSGNIKAHTSDNGIYQTGVPYKNSSEAKIHPYKPDYVNGSIIEFTGKDPKETGTMSEYIVDYLIIYPKGEGE